MSNFIICLLFSIVFKIKNLKNILNVFWKIIKIAHIYNFKISCLKKFHLMLPAVYFNHHLKNIAGVICEYDSFKISLQIKLNISSDFYWSKIISSLSNFQRQSKLSKTFSQNKALINSYPLYLSRVSVLCIVLWSHSTKSLSFLKLCCVFISEYTSVLTIRVSFFFFLQSVLIIIIF